MTDLIDTTIQEAVERFEDKFGQSEFYDREVIPFLRSELETAFAKLRSEVIKRKLYPMTEIRDHDTQELIASYSVQGDLMTQGHNQALDQVLSLLNPQTKP